MTRSPGPSPRAFVMSGRLSGLRGWHSLVHRQMSSAVHSMIPKILHQLWIGPRPRPVEMMDTWKTLYPDWEYVLWDEERLASSFPDGLQNQAQFDAMEEYNGKCDIARYEILRKYGGFFVDADAICLRPIEDHLLENQAFSCYENELLRGQLIAVGYLATEPGCPLLDAVIDHIGTLHGRDLFVPGLHSAWHTVGPVMFTSLVHRERFNGITVYPSWYFVPRHYSGELPYAGPGQPYADQRWGSTPTFTDFNYDEPEA